METRLIWLAIISIFGFAVGVVAGILAWLAGSPTPEAVLVGGMGFAGVAGLSFSVKSFMH